MSKRCELQKEYYKQYGNYKGNGKYCDKYVSWLENEVLALRQPPVSGSDWEHKLIGKNIHSVFTWCKNCHSEGVNIQFNEECGNCGSKNTVRYYDKETIDLLF